MSGAPHSRDDEVEGRSAFIHQEFVKLAILIGFAIAAFFVTRAIAASNRALSLRDAADWYGRGERALAAGRPSDAVDAFRRASQKKHGDRQYQLALARALVTTHQDEPAERALLALRESAPDDPDANLELARIEAARGNSPAALRYYRNALYAPWPPDQSDARRQVRIELIRFLVTAHEPDRAEPELVALTSDLPDSQAWHLEVGNLFLTVGDNHRALDQFEQALRLAPQDQTTLAGAGRASFALGDYGKAQRYLRDLSSPSADLLETRTLVDLVLAGDPLAIRIGSSARRSRLIDALARVNQRLEACSQSSPGMPSSLTQLADEAAKTATELTRSQTLESDTIENGLDLIDRAEHRVTITCPPVQPLDRALMLIAARHGVGTP